MRAGSATRTINCELGDDLAGQLHRRLCERIRDDLEANFLYLADKRESALLVNLDSAGLFEWSYVRRVTAAVAAKTGVPARNVIITSTHTHDAPDTLGLLHDSPRNDGYLAKLHKWIVAGAEEAVRTARPVSAGASGKPAPATTAGSAGRMVPIPCMATAASRVLRDWKAPTIPRTRSSSRLMIASD